MYKQLRNNLYDKHGMLLQILKILLAEMFLKHQSHGLRLKMVEFDIECG